jgi:D-alanyl-D-alanine carboxypeptidase
MLAMISPRIESVLLELGIAPEVIVARNLPECAEASELEVAEIGVDGREYLLIPAAVSAWKNMKAAALADGIELNVVSAFRSVERQAEIVRRKLAAGVSVEDVLSVNAPPGFSEHHTGRALDLTTPRSPVLETGFEQTAAFAWLLSRAGEFGFVLSYPRGNPCGFQYEPWHWCYRVS